MVTYYTKRNMNEVAPTRNGLTNEPRPFLLDRPRSISPVLLTCEHATRRLPRSAGLDSRHRAVLASHWGWDTGAWKLTRELARRLRAGAIGGRWSRLLIDLNRRVDDPTLIRRHVEGLPLPWNAGLDTDEIERRILAYHAPYHLEVDRLILRRLVRGVRPLVLAKGAVDHWVAVVRPGRILFEMAGVPDDVAREALRLAASKFPMATKVVTRHNIQASA